MINFRANTTSVQNNHPETTITFLGATHTVTGSKYLITKNNTKILIDCGLFQGLKELRLRNWAPLPFAPAEINAVILTHAHIDHCGYLPILVRDGFRGKIYCSYATKDLCEIILPDSGHLHEEEAKYANKKGSSKHHPALPLYTKEDAQVTLKYFAPADYEKIISLPDNLSFKLIASEHILGSSFVNFFFDNKNILFSGDLGKSNSPLMLDPPQIEKATYVVVESTYGDRLHENINIEEKLASIINQTIKQNGTILIPAFAVGRTQIMLYYIYKLCKTNKIPKIPVYIDSPMATHVSSLYEKYYKEEAITKEDCSLICACANFVSSVEESKKLSHNQNAKIIISASGMATGGRILHHLKAFLPDKNSVVLLVGYQAIGTRGARLINGEKEIKIFGDMIPVKAKIEILHGMSAHADYQDILNWLKGFKYKPQKTFITHGEPNASKSLQEKIEKNLQWNCVVPNYLQSFSL